VGLADRVIDVNVGDLSGAAQQRRPPRQGREQAGSDRIQLAHVPEPERPQERAQRRRRPHPLKEPVHRAVPQQIHVLDRVRARDHPRDQRRNLDRRIRRRHGQPLAQQLGQPGLLGQSHHRRQPHT
jgi:hypothetical protein